MHFLTQHAVVKFFTESFWRDEAFSWAMAKEGLGILPLTARDFNPPLYYLLMYGWMQLVGSSEMAMRSLSVLFFAATLYVAWRFMIDLLGVPRRRAAAYLLLFALNPMLAYYAVEARMYSLLALLAATSLYAHLAKRPGLYIAATTAGLYTHYFMLLVIGCQVVGMLSGAPRVLAWRRRLVVLAAPLLLLAPWVLLTLWLKEDYGSAFWVEWPGWRFGLHLVTSIFTGHDAIYGFLERPERWLFALCLLPTVMWSLWAGYAWIERRPVVLNTAVLALLPPALIFAVTFMKPLYVPRYLIFCAVGLLLLLIAGMERAAPRVRAVLFVGLCALSIHYQVLQAHRHSKGAFRETITEAAGRAAPEDLLYVRRELDFFPAQYYFGASRVFVLGRKYHEIPAFTGKVLIPSNQVVPTMPSTPGRAFILYGDTDLFVLNRTRKTAEAMSGSPGQPLAVGAGQR